MSANSNSTKGTVKQAAFEVNGEVTGVTEVEVCSNEKRLYVSASDAFGPLNDSARYLGRVGYPTGFRMATLKGCWTFTYTGTPEEFDGEAMTFTTTVVSPDQSEVTWTMVVFCD